MGKQKSKQEQTGSKKHFSAEKHDSGVSWLWERIRAVEEKESHCLSQEQVLQYRRAMVVHHSCHSNFNNWEVGTWEAKDWYPCVISWHVYTTE